MINNDIVILDQFLQDYKTKRNTHKNDAEIFEFFSAEQILKDYDPTDEDIEYGNTGGGADGGIDSVFLYINDNFIYEDSDLSSYQKNALIKFYIIQSKKEQSFREKVFEKLITSIKDLFDLTVNLQEMRSSYNEKIITLFTIFRKAYQDLQTKFPEVFIYIYYTSKGDAPHPKVTRKGEMLKDDISKYFSDAHVDIIYFGARELITRARTQPKTIRKLQLAETPIMPEADFHGGSTAIIALTTLNEYYKFITDENRNLVKNIFEANVRDYQGRTTVNRNIANSLFKSEDSDFWWLNNGVTIIATKASIIQKKLTLECPEIVNGLQTSIEIHKFILSKDNNYIDKRKILIRIIVPENDAIRDKIILATNSQTCIPSAYLRATDPLHRDIEDFFYRSGFFYERRKNFYKNQEKDSKKIVSIGKLAQSVISILLQEPHQARARPSSLISKDDTYKRIFSTEYSMDLYLNCIKILILVEDFQSRNESSLTYGDRINIKFYMAMVIALFLQPTLAYNINHNSLSELTITSVNDDILKNAENIVCRIYEKFGRNDAAVKNSEMTEAILKAFKSNCNCRDDICP